MSETPLGSRDDITLQAALAAQRALPTAFPFRPMNWARLRSHPRALRGRQLSDLYADLYRRQVWDRRFRRCASVSVLPVTRHGHNSKIQRAELHHRHRTEQCRSDPSLRSSGQCAPMDRTLYVKVVRGSSNRAIRSASLLATGQADRRVWWLQTFCEESYEFHTLIDPIATYCYQPVSTQPTIKIVPGAPAIYRNRPDNPGWREFGQIQVRTNGATPLINVT